MKTTMRKLRAEGECNTWWGDAEGDVKVEKHKREEPFPAPGWL